VVSLRAGHPDRSLRRILTAEETAVQTPQGCAGASAHTSASPGVPYAREVSTLHRLTRDDARRVAVRAQLLTRPRPDDLLAVVGHLGAVQHDGTAAVAPSADLVAWSRVGGRLPRDAVDGALADGSLVELEGMLRPAEDLALFRAEMAAWPGRGPLKDWQEAGRDWVEANDGCRRQILEVLRGDGPLPARDLPDTTVVPWRSSGWNDDRNVRMLLQLMVRRGEVAVAGREGRERLYDLAERVYPDDPVVPLDEALAIRTRRRLRGLGLARPRGPAGLAEGYDAGDAGEPAVVEGIRGHWRVDPAYLDVDTPGRTALLSPLDRLIVDRKRMADLFGFDYQLEMYKPVAQRRWGYWAMPVLHGDRLVGKLDATADREAGVLHVDAVHEDGDWSRRRREDVDAEIAALAAWLGLAVARSSRAVG
jgi:uncharacterized protein YcaQ